MWDGLVTLVFLCIVMALASLAAGILPLSLSLSSRQLRLITALGTGVLVGTALIVIIPEGIDTLYSASATEGSRGHAERSFVGLVSKRATIDNFPGALKHDAWRRDLLLAGVDTGQSAAPLAGSRTRSDRRDDLEPSSQDSGRDEGTSLDDTAGTGGRGATHTRDPHAYVGISLIFGFVLMYLIDTLPQTTTSASRRPQRFPISLNQFSLTRTPSLPNGNGHATHIASDSVDPFSLHSQSSHPPSSASSRPSSTTVGLVIHAVADGIALGASSTNTTSRLSWIIFLALMIHKAPAAFGLTSVLLKQGLSKRLARAHLVVFSLAAPVGALLTWVGAHALDYSGSDGQGSEGFYTGLLLLFSGGTFLYVAMHTMQEGASDGGHDGHDGAGHAGMNGYAGVSDLDYYDEAQSASQQHGKQGPALSDLLVTVAGMLLPLLTQWGHAH